MANKQQSLHDKNKKSDKFSGNPDNPEVLSAASGIAPKNDKRALSKNIKEREADEILRELKCLFDITKIMDNKELPLEEILKRVAETVSLKWKAPDKVSARLIHRHVLYQNDDFRETPWKLAESLDKNNIREGTLEIYYPSKELAVSGDGQKFLQEVTEIIITSIKRTQSAEALWKSEKKYRLLLESLQEGILAIDNSGRLTFANDSFLNMAGLDRREVAGKHLFTLLDRSGIELFENVSMHTQGHRTYDLNIFKKNGDPINCLAVASRITGAGESGTIISLVDITERKKMEEKALGLYKYLGVINRKISVILGLGKDNGRKSKREIAKYINNSARTISQAEQSLLYVYSGNDEFELKAGSGNISAENLKKLRRLNSRSFPALKEFIFYRSRLQISVGQTKIPALPGGGGIGQYLILPVLKNSDLAGIFILGFKDKSQITTQELELYDVFSMHASVILQDIL